MASGKSHVERTPSGKLVLVRKVLKLLSASDLIADTFAAKKHHSSSLLAGRQTRLLPESQSTDVDTATISTDENVANQLMFTGVPLQEQASFARVRQNEARLLGDQQQQECRPHELFDHYRLPIGCHQHRFSRYCPRGVPAADPTPYLDHELVSYTAGEDFECNCSSCQRSRPRDFHLQHLVESEKFTGPIICSRGRHDQTPTGSEASEDDETIGLRDRLPRSGLALVNSDDLSRGRRHEWRSTGTTQRRLRRGAGDRFHRSDTEDVHHTVRKRRPRSFSSASSDECVYINDGLITSAPGKKKTREIIQENIREHAESRPFSDSYSNDWREPQYVSRRPPSGPGSAQGRYSNPRVISPLRDQVDRSESYDTAQRRHLQTERSHPKIIRGRPVRSVRVIRMTDEDEMYARRRFAESRNAGSPRSETSSYSSSTRNRWESPEEDRYSQLRDVSRRDADHHDTEYRHRGYLVVPRHHTFSRVNEEGIYRHLNPERELRPSARQRSRGRQRSRRRSRHALPDTDDSQYQVDCSRERSRSNVESLPTTYSSWGHNNLESMATSKEAERSTVVEDLRRASSQQRPSFYDKATEHNRGIKQDQLRFIREDRLNHRMQRKGSSENPGNRSHYRRNVHFDSDTESLDSETGVFVDENPTRFGFREER